MNKFLFIIFVGASFLLNTAVQPSTLSAQAVGDIRGTVTDNTGAVVPSAKITATNEQTGQQRTATTTQNGEFLIPSVPLGEYKVRVEVTGFAAWEGKTNVSVGQESTLNIRLFLGSAQPRGGTLKFKLVDAKGSTVAGASVTILGKNGQTVISDVADQDGSYETTVLSGDYAIKATSGTSLHAEKQVHLKSGQTKEIKLTLR